MLRWFVLCWGAVGGCACRRGGGQPVAVPRGGELQGEGGTEGWAEGGQAQLPVRLARVCFDPCPIPNRHPSLALFATPSRPPHTPPHLPPLQVEDDDTALRLAAELSRGKCGRVSFMPLNRLKPQAVKYPEQVGAAGAAAGSSVGWGEQQAACQAAAAAAGYPRRRCVPPPHSPCFAAHSRPSACPRVSPPAPVLPHRRSTAPTWSRCSKSSSTTRASSPPSARRAAPLAAECAASAFVGGWVGRWATRASSPPLARCSSWGAGGAALCAAQAGAGTSAPCRPRPASRLQQPSPLPAASDPRPPGVWQDAGVPQPGRGRAGGARDRAQLRDHGGGPGGSRGRADGYGCVGERFRPARLRDHGGRSGVCGCGREG